MSKYSNSNNLKWTCFSISVHVFGGAMDLRCAPTKLDNYING